MKDMMTTSVLPSDVVETSQVQQILLDYCPCLSSSSNQTHSNDTIFFYAANTTTTTNANTTTSTLSSYLHETFIKIVDATTNANANINNTSPSRWLQPEDENTDDKVLWELIFVSITIMIMFYFLITDKLSPDWVMLSGLIIFMVTNIITIEEGLAGFSNEGILTVLALFVVADGISRTGALDYYMGMLLGRPTTIAGAQIRLTIPVLLISAFFNNTPIVAIMIPVTIRWSKMIGCPKQQLLIPLSYATILGGTCTLVGTSTNLVVSGLLKKAYPNEPAGQIQLFDIAIYGVPNAIIGLLYMLSTGPYLLPGGKKGMNQKGGTSTSGTSGTSSSSGLEHDDLLLGARVMNYSPVAGRTVKRSGLNSSAGIYLVNVRRALTGNIHHAVSRDFVVSVGDDLYFTGKVEAFSTFCQQNGLMILTSENTTTTTSTANTSVNNSNSHSNHNKQIMGEEVDGMDDSGTPAVTMTSVTSGNMITTGATQMDSTSCIPPNGGNGVIDSKHDNCTERLQLLNRISDQIAGQIPVEPGPRPTRVIVSRDMYHTDDLILVAIDCHDRMGLMSDIADTLFQRVGLQIKHSEANVINGRSLSVWRCEFKMKNTTTTTSSPTNTTALTTATDAISDPNKVAVLDYVWSAVSQVLSDVIGTDSTSGASSLLLSSPGSSAPAFDNKTSGAQVVRAIIPKHSTLIGKKPMDMIISSSSIYQAAIVAYQKSNGKNAESYTPFDQGDVLILATQDHSPLLSVPPHNYYHDNKKETKMLKAHSHASLLHSPIIATSSLNVGEAGGGASGSVDHDDADHQDDTHPKDLEQDDNTNEVWNNLRVIFDSNVTSTLSSSGGTSEVPKGEFLTAFTIPPKSPLDGKTLSEVGYSKLPGVVLVSCERPITTKIDDVSSKSTTTTETTPITAQLQRFLPISPNVDTLKVGDVLWFTGSAEAIADLQRLNGLELYRKKSTSVGGGMKTSLQDRRLVQAVVARGSPLVGRTVIHTTFRKVYGGVVIAIQRGNERVHEYPGDVILQTGDVLLIEADTAFVKNNSRNYKVFALVSEVEDSSPPRPQMFFISIVLIGTAFTCSAFDLQSLFVLSSLVGIAMALLGVLTQQEARDAIEWSLFIVVASAFGIASAMTNSGLAKVLAEFIVKIGEGINIGDAGIYGAVYLSITLLSSILTNNAAAALSFPIAMSAVEQTGTDRLKMGYIMMLSASDYITSFGYQTNLMVYGPGEYSNLDYLRFGGILQIVLWITSTAMITISTPETWYISWIVCFLGFIAFILIRELKQSGQKHLCRHKKTNEEEK